jgi:hypothetical protein
MQIQFSDHTGQGNATERITTLLVAAAVETP